MPADIIAAAAPAVYAPKRGDTVALINKQDCSLRYAQRLGPADTKKYSLKWADAMCTLHDTGAETDAEDDAVHPVVWWEHSKWDHRVCGPADQVFPRPDGWLLDGKEVRLDKLNIKVATKAMAMRRFREPACKRAWQSRLGQHYVGPPNFGPSGPPASLPWPKIFKMKSFFATPRDQVAGLKLQHRNLYLPDTCLACNTPLQSSKQTHYCRCGVIRAEFWDVVLDWLRDTGMPTPQDTTIFIATGALSDKKAINEYYAGLWFIAHRTLYAAMMNAHMENKQLNLEAALKRALALTIGRLKAYGGKWGEWVRTARWRRQPNKIGEKHQDKRLMRQDEDGNYELHPALLNEADRLQLR